MAGTGLLAAEKSSAMAAIVCLLTRRKLVWLLCCRMLSRAARVPARAR